MLLEELIYPDTYDDSTLLSEDELKQDVKTCIENGAKGVVIFRYGLSKNIDFNGV